MILGIYGSGGSGREVKEIAETIKKWDEIVFIDDTIKSDEFKGIKRMPFSMFQQMYSNKQAVVVIALGEPQYKFALYNKVKNAGYSLENVIHPTAVISPSAKLGKGIIIKAGAVVSVDTVIEDNVCLEQYVVVAHDVMIHAHTQISAFVMLAGHCEVGEETFIGLSVPVREHVKIGTQCIIGMGSVVVKNVENNVVVVGNPARTLRRVDGENVFK